MLTHSEEAISVDLSDRVSEDVIKIFHNAKVSIFKDVIKWTEVLSNEQKTTYQVQNTGQCEDHYSVVTSLSPIKNIK